MTYTYDITNTGQGDVTVVSVLDDQLGQLVGELADPVIPAGETASLEASTILWYTTEMDELDHCDHVYVFRDGRIVADLPRDQLSEEKVLHASFGEAA